MFKYLQITMAVGISITSRDNHQSWVNPFAMAFSKGDVKGGLAELIALQILRRAASSISISASGLLPGVHAVALGRACARTTSACGPRGWIRQLREPCSAVLDSTAFSGFHASSERCTTHSVDNMTSR